MSEAKTIKWDIPMRERMRKAYERAAAEGMDSFIFEGNHFVTNYAKYLLEFLDMKLGPK